MDETIAKLADLGAEFKSLVEAGEFEKAIEVGQEAILIDPTNIVVIREVGDTYAKLNPPMWGKAEEYHLMCLKIDETSIYSLKTLAAIASNVGDLQGSLDYLNKAQELKPEDHQIKCMIAGVESVLNRQKTGE